MANAVTLNNNTMDQRYELLSEGKIFAIATYKLKDGVITIMHTETMPEYAGEGYASQLAQHVLDDVSRKKLHVVPMCAFIAGFISKNPEYEKLILRS